MMDITSTKATAEEALRGLPAVLGAFVREDFNGHPREVHLLVGPGPDPRELARDVRKLLYDRLGIEVDQRIISIAQLTTDLDRLSPDTLPGWTARGPADERAEVSGERTANAAPAPTSTPAPVATPGLGTRPVTGSEEPEPVPARAIYQGVESSIRDGQVTIRVRLSWRDNEYIGEGREIDGGLGRIRAAANATLEAAAAACKYAVRFDLESASMAQALGREFVLITALASATSLGRRPLTLVGAQPLEFDIETTTVLATLHAINRTLARMLDR